MFHYAQIALEETCVDSIISNVYLKNPDSTVRTETVLSEVAAKISTEESELVLLDSKFVPISDDRFVLI